jgi:MFS family permease
VFGSAIGLFTLGSFFCGISSNIHLLVACRVLQGCGGAMMVPVGRLTMVRTFAKSELIMTNSSATRHLTRPTFVCATTVRRND